MFDVDDDCLIFPLQLDLNDAPRVDEDKLVLSDPIVQSRPIGMGNFRTRHKHQNTPNITKPTVECISPARIRWRTAMRQIKLIEDPWAKFKIENYSEEVVIRHRYSPVKNQWIQDENIVKMEPQQFANGAMRACYRLKKLSNFSHDKSWDHASNNVAKCYIDPDMPRERYFEDVKLQMDAKLWAELYNRHNPPKKIDMIQVAIIEFKNRPGSPLYHLEHYIEGEYIKYNSNSGFVDVGLTHVRNTPHAFSHFTFESSNHDLMVVDIQGVGDLYTDPQIHTAFSTEYGEGNLNIKGFALFFYSHVCNDICKSLGLKPFDLANSELESHEKRVHTMNTAALTKSKGNEECIHNAFYKTRGLFKRYDSVESQNSCDIPELDELDTAMMSYSPSFSSFYHSPIPTHRQTNKENSLFSRFSHNNHSTTSNFSTSFTESPNDVLKFLNSKICLKQVIPIDTDEKNSITTSCCAENRNLNRQSKFDLVLGKIHLEMCKYHEMGRFVDEDDSSDEIDIDAAFYHLKHSANLGEIEALVNISKIYMQLPRDILPDYKVEETDANFETGFDYLLEAAEKCDKTSLYYVAKAFDTGFGLPKSKTIDWNKAIQYYKKIINDTDDVQEFSVNLSELSNDCEEIYVILARIGEIYMQGGFGVDQYLEEAVNFFNEAADKAMQSGKGRLANKYFSLSEKAAALL